MSRRILCAAGVVTGLLAVSCATTVASKETLDASTITALEAFPYDDWSTVVTTYVNGAGRVDYTALKANGKELDRFVALLAVVGPKTRPELFPSKDDKLAYYINAYNAFTMFNVINRYPEIDTVVTNKENFFYFTKFRMDGGEINLYDLENSIVRPEFKDPRIHFALNCASIGCPVLPNRIFDPASLSAQLDEETQKFLHEPRNVSVESGTLWLSEIFNWYADDFPPDAVRWINTTAPDLALPKGPVQWRPYDWGLNDQARVKVSTR